MKGGSKGMELGIWNWVLGAQDEASCLECCPPELVEG